MRLLLLRREAAPSSQSDPAQGHAVLRPGPQARFLLFCVPPPCPSWAEPEPCVPLDAHQTCRRPAAGKGAQMKSWPAGATEQERRELGCQQLRRGLGRQSTPEGTESGAGTEDWDPGVHSSPSITCDSVSPQALSPPSPQEQPEARMSPCTCRMGMGSGFEELHSFSFPPPHAWGDQGALKKYIQE